MAALSVALLAELKAACLVHKKAGQMVGRMVQSMAAPSDNQWARLLDSTWVHEKDAMLAVKSAVCLVCKLVHWSARKWAAATALQLVKRWAAQ